MWGAISWSVILIVLTPDEKQRHQRGDETPLTLWFAASRWRGSAQALSVMLAPPPGVLSAGEPLTEYLHDSTGFTVNAFKTMQRLPPRLMHLNNRAGTSVWLGYNNINFVFEWVASCYYCEMTSIALRYSFLRIIKHQQWASSLATQ